MNPEFTFTLGNRTMNKTLYCENTGNPTPEFLIELAKMLGGRPWANHGKFRVYFDEGRKTQVYLNFEDGWSLNIWLEPCGQTAKWYANRKRDLQQQYTRHIRIAIGSHHFGEPVTAYSPETNADIEKMVAEFTAKMDQVCA